MFGITRTTAAEYGSKPSINSMVFPAAMEITNGSFFCKSAPTDGRSVGNTFGFTASTTASANAINSAQVSAVPMPKVCFNISAFCRFTSYAQISAAWNAPERTAPSIIADAILPAPINPIFIKTSLFCTTYNFAHAETSVRKILFLIPPRKYSAGIWLPQYQFPICSTDTLWLSVQRVLRAFPFSAYRIRC